MQFRYIDQPLQEEWEKLIKRNPASGFMQSFFWTHFTNLLGWPTFKIGAFEQDQLVAGTIVTKFYTNNGHNYLYIPQGPVIDYASHNAQLLFDGLLSEIDHIVDFEGESITSHLRIDPRITHLPSFFHRLQKAPIDIEPLRTLVIDLTESSEKILSQMKHKGRYNIKIAQRDGINVTSTDLKTGLDTFLHFYKTMVDRKQFAGKEEHYFHLLSQAVDSSEEVKVYFASFNDQILAVAIIVFYGYTVTYLFGASSLQYREKMAPYLLQWEIISQAKQLGYKLYDFYGITPDENDPLHPWQGFTTFKEKFGGRKIRYIGSYDFVYNQGLYNAYLKEKNEIIESKEMVSESA